VYIPDLDGTHKSVEVGPSTTSQDVCESVVKKLLINETVAYIDINTFALFEVIGKQGEY
jgi:hypothetical protein